MSWKRKDLAWKFLKISQKCWHTSIDTSDLEKVVNRPQADNPEFYPQNSVIRDNG